MAIAYTRTFIKQSKKLSPELRQQLQDRILLFIKNPLNPTFRNHALKGKYKDYRSINITGDIRAIYLQSNNETIFSAVGSHSQLYG